MKPLIVYCTRTQNTLKVAAAIADALCGDLLPAASVTGAELDGRGLVGLGSGVYWTSLDPALYQVARLVPRDTKVFTFATSGFRSDMFVGLYRAKIERKLIQCGCEAIAHWHCPGHDKHFLTRAFGLSKGRPNRNDLEEAQSFALRMAERVSGSR